MKKIEKKLIKLIKTFKQALSEDAIKFLVDLAEYGEYGMSLEILCENLFEDNIKPDKGQWDLIRDLASKMEMKKETYSFLE